MSDAVVRLAMWSGPRNISTALMRAWENRPDTQVVDEPLYAAYLKATGKDHPGREQIIAHYETDWNKLFHWLTSFSPAGASLWYQKHMAHHLLPHLPRQWVLQLRNAFLIRDPARVVVSLSKKLKRFSLEDTGLPQQVELFELVRSHTGQVPPVIDAQDVLRNPRGMLRALCRAWQVEFSEQMLHWPSGPRASDGIWGPWWYGEVYRTTGFRPWQPQPVSVPRELQPLVRECQQLYDHLAQYRLKPL